MTRFLALLLATVALPAAAGEIWVTNEKDDTISVIDVATLEVTRTIPTGERPRGIRTAGFRTSPSIRLCPGTGC